MMTRLGTLVSLVVLAACASSGGTRPATRGSTASRWSGSFRSTGSSSSAMFGPATPNRGSGTISLAPLGSGVPATRVELSIRDAPPSATVAWAVFGGNCGSPEPIVAGQNQFPVISLSSSGEGHVKTDISFVLDPKSSYHANVYFTPRANDMNDIMMCANLTPE